MQERWLAGKDSRTSTLRMPITGALTYMSGLLSLGRHSMEHDVSGTRSLYCSCPCSMERVAGTEERR